MIKTNIILAYRSLMKEKGFTIINTIGLALGVACFILIMVYVMHERSYEKFREDHERMYRVYQHGTYLSNMENFNQGFIPFPASEFIAKTYPEVEKVVTIDQYGGLVITYKDKSFQEWRSLLVDSNFFEMFPADFIVGNIKTALNGPHKMVLTETAAHKWFGTENPLGKLVKAGSDSVLYEVTGVVKDPRTDTHIKYSMLLSDQSFKLPTDNSWVQSRGRFVYLMLRKGASANELEPKLQVMITDFFIPEAERLLQKSAKELFGNQKLPQYKLQPIDEAHLNPILNMDIGGISGNPMLVTIALIIAFAILLLACINFINLSTARFSNRMKEVCIKKTFGSSKSALFTQFISESYILTAIAILLALALCELFINPFCDALQLEYIISFYQLSGFVPFILTVFVLVGFLSGAYPALVMSNTQIISGLKGRFTTSGKGTMLRKILVVTQFIISFIILLGMIVVSKQLHYIFESDKGYSDKNLVVLHNVSDIPLANRKALKEEIAKQKGVLGVSYTNIYPRDLAGHTVFWREGDSLSQKMNFMVTQSDADFFKTLNITLTQGRLFDPNRIEDSLSVIINESAAKLLGYKNPIGKQITNFSGDSTKPNITFTIIGVVKDYNIRTIRQKIEPHVMWYTQYQAQDIVIKTDGSNTAEILRPIEKIWKQYSNGNNLATEDMQEVLSWLYRGERSANKLVSCFAVICILIACLGLIGLVSYSTLRRTKEIGIRKANGAQVWQIVLTLSRETMILIGIAIVIGLPIGVWLVNLWLQQFAYHVEVSVGLIATAVLGLYLIALLSEISLTLRAARQNPVKALRYE